MNLQRNAQKLGYFKDNNLFIASLQLLSLNDGELEDLDSDLTLGELSACMEGKHLVAISKSKNLAPEALLAISSIANATHACDNSIADHDNGELTTPDVEVAMAKLGAIATHGGGSLAEEQPLSIPFVIATMTSFSNVHPMQQSLSVEASKTEAPVEFM